MDEELLYTLKHFPAHLAETEEKEELKQLLTDFEFLKLKVERVGVYPLVEDYLLIDEEDEESEVYQWRRFVDSQSHFFAREPELFFPAAVNQPVNTLVAQTAERYSAKNPLPYLRWVNKPEDIEEHPALVRTLRGHKGGVYAVAVSPDNRFIVSGGCGNTLIIWELKTGKAVMKLRGLESFGYHSVIVISPDNRYVAASAKNMVIVWELKTGKINKILQIDEGVTAISPDNRYVISVNNKNKTINVWELNTEKNIITLCGHTDIINSLIVSRNNHYIIARQQNDGMLIIWELKTGKPIMRLQGHLFSYDIAVSSDNRYIISCCYRDRDSLMIREFNTGKEVMILEGHTSWITAITVSSDNRYVLSGSLDKTIIVWELNTGKAVMTLWGHTDSVKTVAISSDNRYIVSGSQDSTLKIWRLITDKKEEIPYRCTSESEISEKEYSKGRINDIAITPDNHYIVSSGEEKVLKLWELSTGKSLMTLQGNKGSINTIAISPDNRYIIGGSDSVLMSKDLGFVKDRGFIYVLRVWGVSTGKLIMTLPGNKERVSAIAISPDSRYVIASSGDNEAGLIIVWELKTGKAVTIFQDNHPWSKGIAVTSDNCFVISQGSGTLRIWELATGKSVMTFEGYYNEIKAIVSVEDNRYLILGSNRDNMIIVRELIIEIKEMPEFPVFESNLSNRLLSLFKKIFFKSLLTKQPVWTFEKYTADAVSLTSDNQYMVMFKERALMTLQGHTSWIKSISVTHDNRFIVSCSDDHMLKVWDINTGKNIATFPAKSDVNACACAATGEIVCGDASGQIYILRLEGV